MCIVTLFVAYILTHTFNKSTQVHKAVATTKNTPSSSVPTSTVTAVPLADQIKISNDTASKAVVPTTPCSANKLDKLIVVSISSRHLWSCEVASVVFDSAVITGMQNIAADLTPTGTYHVYSKQTNLYLKGSDSTGSWNDYVYYWMPFLNNQYGTYGFHDATWRANSEFGSVDPYSANASHGCVELPLATAKWLFSWAVVGTTLTVVS